MMQTALIQDASEATKANPAPGNLLRIVTIDILSGQVTHQYAYQLTTGSGVSEICAINDHEFLVDERDGKGREGNSDGSSNAAAIKQLFKIDLDDAVDISGMDGTTASTHAVNKTLFLDIVPCSPVSASIPTTFRPRSKASHLVRTSEWMAKRFTLCGLPMTMISSHKPLMSRQSRMTTISSFLASPTPT